MYVLGLVEDDHTTLTSNEVVVEQAHLDEADAQSDTGFGVNLLFQAVVLDPVFGSHWMNGQSADAVEVLKFLRCFQSPASQQGLHESRSQLSRHFRRYEDQSGNFLSSLGPAILPVSFHLELVASAEDSGAAELLFVVVA